jgi:hypothetical protein
MAHLHILHEAQTRWRARVGWNATVHALVGWYICMLRSAVHGQADGRRMPSRPTQLWLCKSHTKIGAGSPRGSWRMKHLPVGTYPKPKICTLPLTRPIRVRRYKGTV